MDGCFSPPPAQNKGRLREFGISFCRTPECLVWPKKPPPLPSFAWQGFAVGEAGGDASFSSGCSLRPVLGAFPEDSGEASLLGQLLSPVSLHPRAAWSGMLSSLPAAAARSAAGQSSPNVVAAGGGTGGAALPFPVQALQREPETLFSRGVEQLRGEEAR